MKVYVVFVKSVMDEFYNLSKGQVMGAFDESQSNLAYKMCKTMNNAWQDIAQFEVNIRRARKATDVFNPINLE